jgi:nicotinate-nucleotide--dimethylbenzimidazole phosphoribosyltransferase
MIPPPHPTPTFSTQAAPAPTLDKLQGWLENLVAEIRPARREDPIAVRARLDQLTKPVGSLGALERLALRLALIYGDPPPPLRRRTVLVLAADHGVAARGVSAYPAEVTAQMCRNYAAGGAAINAIARAVSAEVVAVDVGVAADPSTLAVASRKVRWGTADLSAGPAMARLDALQAIRTGAALVDERAEQTDLFALGEMGIGSTTSAAALTAVLCCAPPEAVVGAGTGVDARTLDRKRSIVSAAVKRIAPGADPVSVLAELGGLEIAALVGVALAAARAQRAVVADGFITCAAVLVASRLAPAVLDYVIASHRSVEPGHTIQLRALGLDPLLDLELRLGEGTGAALAFPIVDAAGAVLREMATFAGAGVSGPEARP